MEDFYAFAVCLFWFWEDDFVDAERGFVEDDFGLRFGCEINCFRNEEVYERDDACVDGCADSEGEFKSEILNDEASEELTKLDSSHNEQVPNT